MSSSSSGVRRFGVGVLDADELHGRRMRLGHHLRHAHAQSAVHQVLFGDHDGAGLARRPRDRFAVERLDGVHVDHARGDALRFERLRRADRFGHQQAVGDERDIRALHQLDRLADLELPGPAP